MLEEESARTATQRALRLLVRIARPHRNRIVLLLVLAVAQSGLAAIAPWLVALAVDIGIDKARALDYWPLGYLSLALAACAAISAILNRIWRRQAGEIGQLVVFELRIELIGKLQQLSIAFHERLRAGRIIARITSDVETVNALFGTTLTGLLQAVLGIVITTAAMFALDPALASITVVALMPLGGLTWWTVRRLRQAFADNRAAIADMTVQVVESLNAMRVVAAYQQETSNDQRFTSIVDRERTSSRAIQLARGVYWPATELVFSLATILVLLVGGSRVMSGAISIGVLGAFIFYVAQYFQPITSMSAFLDALQSAIAALGKIDEILREPAGVAEPNRPVNPPAPARGEVEFKNVQFGYDGDRPESAGNSFTLSQLNLRLMPGQVVAMLGATGAGKTTIAKLMARFYDPTAGQVLLDGIDLRNLADARLRSAVTLLTQEGFLFAGSVADNIRLGQPSATMKEIEAAAAAVGADRTIRGLPEGYDTHVGKRGTRLSAGQRQLIALARAFLANPAVLIFDEATAALDIPTERAMQAGLRTLLAGRTSLIIAHRFSTVEIADRVLVLADGKIVDDGTPADLLARGTGEFAALYRDGHGAAAG